MSLIDFQNTVLQKLGLYGMKRIEILYYRIPISVVHDGVKYDSFVIDNDEDLQVLFYCDCQFPKVRIPDPLAKFVDVVSSSGKSNQNYQSVLMAAASSSTHVGASSSLLVMASIGDLVASLSFATYLHRDEIADVGAYINTPVMTSHSREVGEPNAVEDVLGDDDDVKPTMIEDENNDDIGRSILVRAGRVSSSGTQQYPLHFLNLDLDAMRRQGFPDVESNFGVRDSQDIVGIAEFQTYSIHRGVEYKVLELDHANYYKKCKEFGNSCRWSIWITQRADAAVSIKVLQNTTEAHFGFRPMYKRIWLAKLKVIAQIYRDWEESYNELPRMEILITFPLLLPQ
ncbi:uncharacterized protein LOC107611466 [Arachis ipaensis]|uniref:uncharacterized protein LOC107611466 n=1 Tax=Arachis ipaensis TaxID=130454 RepID=UPI0007AF0C23|nr:uncharacterized protein LOC107611466 [Arachis ipaensis]